MTEANPELADFLRRARARIDPQRAGLPADGRIRRVPGLRREEVALLARVSTDYYTRLEQGRRIIPSAGVVAAIARALDLDEAGTAHLEHLVGPVSPQPPPAPAAQRARVGLLQLVDAYPGTPAMLLGRRTEVLAVNRIARELFTDFAAMPARDRFYVSWMLLAPEARERVVDWHEQARAAVESLRLEAGRGPDDRAMLELVATLRSASPEFLRWWDDHGVYQRSHGRKRFRHGLVGELTLQFETLTVPSDPGQTLFLFTAEPGSRSAEALDVLASWSLQPRPL